MSNDKQPPEGVTATTLDNLVLASQLGVIRRLAREAGHDADKECVMLYGCRTEELSRDGAESLIWHLETTIANTGKAVA